jgi:short subunit dehydrogenase-like uncharacterized protein
MKQTEQFLIYGATGYTGKLTARTARDKGLKPILAGRNETKLLSHLVFDILRSISLIA